MTTLRRVEGSQLHAKADGEVLLYPALHAHSGNECHPVLTQLTLTLTLTLSPPLTPAPTLTPTLTLRITCLPVGRPCRR